MRKSIMILLLACLSFHYLASCDGSDGNGEEEFAVFDVILNIDSIAECERNEVPGNELKLSLLIRGKNISGTGELLAYGNIGHAEEVKGSTENDSLTLNPFEVRVASDPPPEGSIEFGPNEIWFSFNEFSGQFADENMDGSVDGIDGSFNSLLTIIMGGDIIRSCGEVTGEISGKARVPEGCVSKRELPTFDCLTEGLIILCGYYYDSPEQYGGYFCPGECDETICYDYSFYPAGCEVVDCVSLRSCDGIPDVTNLQVSDSGSVSGNFGTPDNVGESFGCFN